MSNNLIFKIKSKYIWLYRFLDNAFGSFYIGYGILFFLIFCFFFPTILYIDLINDYYSIPSIVSSFLGTFFYILLIINIAFNIFLFNFFVVYLDKKEFEISEYNIYSHKIEIKQGVINNTQIHINLADVKEIHLSQNFIQKKYNIGTIKIITATNYILKRAGRPTFVLLDILSRNFYKSDIKLLDIENPLYVYSELKRLKDELDKKGSING